MDFASTPLRRGAKSLSQRAARQLRAARRPTRTNTIPSRPESRGFSWYVQGLSSRAESLLVFSDVHLGSDLNDSGKSVPRSTEIDRDLAAFLAHYRVCPPA